MNQTPKTNECKNTSIHNIETMEIFDQRILHREEHSTAAKETGDINSRIDGVRFLLLGIV